MPKGRPRSEPCRCGTCPGDRHWEKLNKDGMGLVRCDCGQWVEHSAYWEHRTSDDVG